MEFARENPDRALKVSPALHSQVCTFLAAYERLCASPELAGRDELKRKLKAKRDLLRRIQQSRPRADARSAAGRANAKAESKI
jgi:hypothetical protein